MPPTDASNGSTNRWRSRRSPRSNSRRPSRPSTKKNNVISPLFTHLRSVSWTPPPPRSTASTAPPQLLVGSGVDVHPHERRRRRCEQKRRAAALGAQELAQRALEPARPRGCPRPEVRARGHHPSATLTAQPRAARYATSRRREAVEDSGTSSLELSRVSRLRPVS